MKKLLGLLFVVIISITFSGCSAKTSTIIESNIPAEKESEYNTSKEEASSVEILSVKKMGQTETIAIKDSEIPVVNVLEACGISLKWISEERASFEYNNVTYIIDCQKESICKESQNDNYIIIPPGTDGGFVYGTNGNIYVDYDTMKSILFLLEIDIDISLES